MMAWARCMREIILLADEADVLLRVGLFLIFLPSCVARGMTLSGLK
jgi:hypothetical protein